MEDIISKFNLPSYIKGKSFAEASMLINKKAGERTDFEAVETKRELMERLKQAQEYTKSMEQQSMGQEGTHQMPDGSTMPNSEMQQEQSQSTYAYGGGVEQLKLNKMFGGGGAGAAAAGAGGGGMSPGMGAAISGGGAMIGGLLKQKDPSKSVIAGDPEQNAQMDQLQSTVASAFGPVGMIADGASKVVEGIGDRIGGDGGAYVAGLAAPHKAFAANLQNKDASTGQKIASVIPGVGGIIAKDLADEAAADLHREETTKKHLELDNTFAHGGYTNKNMKQKKYDEGGFASFGKETRFGGLNPFEQKLKELQESGALDSIAGTTDYKAGLSNPTKFKGADGRTNTYGAVGSKGSAGYNTPAGKELIESGKMQDPEGGDGGKKKKGSPLEALRYAPSLMNLAQLAKLKKDGPDKETLGRLNTRYESQQVDEKAMQNAISQQTAANRNAITNSGSGSAAATRANLLANNMQGINALSSAQLAANQANAQDNVRGQNFNIGIDRTNLNQDNSEKTINAQNKGAYDTQMSQLMASLGDNAGSIGKEEMLKKFPELMGMDYNWRGKYQNTAAMGGYTKKTYGYGGYTKKKKKY